MSSLSLFSFEPDNDPTGTALCTVSELTAQIKLLLEGGFAEIALRAGSRLVIVNEQETPFDVVADAVVRSRLGQVLPALAQLV